MKNQIRRLRLREGDIVVCHDSETYRILGQTIAPKGTPSCPIIFVEGSIHRLSKEYLRKVMEK